MAKLRRWLLLTGGTLFLVAMLAPGPQGTARRAAAKRAPAAALLRPAPAAPFAEAARVARTAHAEPARAPAAETEAAAPAPTVSRRADASTPVGPDTTEAYTNRRPRVRGAYYDPRDLAVLRDIIERNGLSEASSPFDYDDGDGRFEPLELGFQEWRFGRLVALHLGPDRYLTFGYGITELPDSVADLDALRVLDLHSSRLATLPPEVGLLESLDELRLFRNELVELPAELGRLGNLRVLVLSSNALAQLPETLGQLRALRELHVDDNPLAALPEALAKLGRLSLLGVSRQATPGTLAPGAGLHELPAGLADLPRLETLLLAGNRLYCGGGAAREPSRVPGFLRDGSVRAVYGLGQQRCGASPGA